MDSRFVQPVVLRASWWQKQRSKILQALWLAFLQILLTALVLTFLVPTIWMVVSSFKASTEIFAYPIKWFPEKLMWRNYAEAVSILPVGRFFVNTVIITTTATVGTVISSAIVAYGFARTRFPGKNLLFGLLLATIMLPEVVTLVPRFIMFRTFGWIDTFLPLTVPYWFATSTWPEHRDYVDALTIDGQFARKKKLTLGMLKFSKYPEICRKFMAYTSSAEGQAIFDRYGLYNIE